MKQRHIYIVMAAMLALTACSDDYFNKDVEHEFSEYIGYSVSVKGSDEFQSRAGVVNGRHITIEPVGESLGGRPLYLHTEVLDSIPQSVTRAKNGAESLSRGTVTYTSGLESINISAVVFDGEKDSWPSGSATAQMYMHNETVSAPSWNTNRYWPKENDWIRFYAYAPCDALSLGEISAAEPSFDYTVAGDIPGQVDLLVGSEQYTGWKCETAQLYMGHALTAVKIHIDGNVSDFTLTSLKISGLKDSGTYTYDYNESTVGDGVETTSTHDAGTWSNLAGEATYTVYNDDAGMPLTKIENDGNGNSLIDPETGKSLGYTDMTAGNMVLFMMPQVLSDNAKITITGIDASGVDVKLSAVIGDGIKEWVKGTMVTYTLSFSSTKIEYVLKVTTDTTTTAVPAPEPVEYYGAKDKPIYVQSYKIVTRNGVTTYEAVPWRALISDSSDADGYREFDIDNDWLVLDDVEGTGKVVKKDNEYKLWHETRHYTMFATEPSSSTSHDNLKDIETRGASDNPWNLSNNKLYNDDKSPLNTANCYIVDRPGYYTFPLVYGNAITGGGVNSGAYNTGWYNKWDMTINLLDPATGVKTSTQATCCFENLQVFKDHNGTGIVDPWITKTYTPASAEIVWQDEPCLVTEVDLNDDKDYITFRVRKDNICEGNAVIAVKDANGTIMWSWHIWVSDGKLRHGYNDANQKAFAHVNDYIDYTKSDEEKLVTRPMINRRITSNNWNDDKEKPVAGSYAGQQFDILMVPLGHCDGENKTYNERTITVRFEQYENTTTLTDEDASQTLQSQVVEFKQKSGNIETYDNVPYYQYGRKDPMLPTKTGNNTVKNWYDNKWSLYKEIKVQSGSVTIAEAIKNPSTYYYDTNETYINNCQYDNWCSEPSSTNPYINLWNAQAGQLPSFANSESIGAYKYFDEFTDLVRNGVTKTVYDPCPPGYEMPRFDAFTGASYNGLNLYPYYYDGIRSSSLFTSNEYDTDGDGYKDPTLNLKANLWIPPNGWYDGNWPVYSKTDATAIPAYNCIGIYSNPMKSLGVRGSSEMKDGGPVLNVHFMGHRTHRGIVDEYGNYASALTSAPAFIQWANTAGGMEDKAKCQLLRLLVIQRYSLRTNSSSDFDLAFPIMPAMTGHNPSDAIIEDINVGWSGAGNSDGYDVEF